MSTFSGFNTGLSGLLSHQRALEVASNNIANLNTVGYTRQRAELVSADGAGRAGLHTGGSIYNGGVNVDAVQRLGDIHLESRVRNHTAESGKLDALAEAWAAAEATINEPTEKGMAEALARFFNDFAEVGTQPQSDAARAVLLEDARDLAGAINTAYTTVNTEWQDARTKASSLISEVNSAASQVAALNDRILTAGIQGTPTGVLEDERARLMVELADKIGAESRINDNGSYDVFVGGGSLVQGSRSFDVRLDGALIMSKAGESVDTGNPQKTGEVRLTWVANDRPVHIDGGRLAGYAQALAPTEKGGILAGMAERYNTLASDLATTVNGIHEAREFFSVTAGHPAAQSLRVAITSTADIDVRGRDAAGDPIEGAFGSAKADEISRAGLGRGGVADRWSAQVVDVGVQTRSVTRRADAAEDTRKNTENALTSKTGVNLDEEVMTLMASQTAYAGAARVITTVDEMLRTLLAMGA